MPDDQATGTARNKPRKFSQLKWLLVPIFLIVAMIQIEKYRSVAAQAKYASSPDLGTLRRRDTITIQFNLAMTQWRELGGLDAATIHTQESIDLRIAAATKVMVTCDALQQFLNETTAGAMSTMDAKVRVPLAAYSRILAGNQRAFADGKEMLEILNQQWGKWKYEKNAGLTFDNLDAGTRYSSLQDKVHQIDAELAQLQQIIEGNQ